MAEQTSVTEDINRLFPFSSLPEDVDKLIRYRFVQVRFGRIQKEYYEKFNTYVYDDLDTMFYPCREDSDYVWGLYFVLWTKMEQVDAVFSSMHFERIYLKKISITVLLRLSAQSITESWRNCRDNMTNGRKKSRIF